MRSRSRVSRSNLGLALRLSVRRRSSSSSSAPVPAEQPPRTKRRTSSSQQRRGSRDSDAAAAAGVRGGRGAAAELSSPGRRALKFFRFLRTFAGSLFFLFLSSSSPLIDCDGDARRRPCSRATRRDVQVRPFLFLYLFLCVLRVAEASPRRSDGVVVYPARCPARRSRQKGLLVFFMGIAHLHLSLLLLSSSPHLRDNVRKSDVRIANIEAAKAVADAVRTSLGPRGMDKMVRGDGERD